MTLLYRHEFFPSTNPLRLVILLKSITIVHLFFLFIYFPSLYDIYFTSRDGLSPSRSSCSAARRSSVPELLGCRAAAGPGHASVARWNLRKTIGKPWENHRKTIGKWWFNGIEWDLPSGNLNMAIEILSLWICSIFTLQWSSMAGKSTITPLMADFPSYKPPFTWDFPWPCLSAEGYNFYTFNSKIHCKADFGIERWS